MNKRQKRGVSVTVGSVYKSNNYGDMIVRDVLSYKQILVEFLNTRNEQMVNAYSLLNGQIIDKKLYAETKLMYVGKICSTKSFGYVEVLSTDRSKCTVKFLNTGNIQTVESGNLRKGMIKDSVQANITCEYKIGTIHKTNSFGDVEVIDIINSHNLTVKFLNTGNEYKVSAGNLKKGNVSDSIYFQETYPFKVGDVFKSNNYGNFSILEFVNDKKHKVKIRFEDTGTVMTTTTSQIGKGTVKDPNSSLFTPKDLGANRFCVYVHKDKNGAVRYVGQGLIKRAKAILGRNVKWYEVFKDEPPIIEYIKTGLSKEEAEDLEQELISRYSDTIVNRIKTYSRAREMDFDFFDRLFYVSKESKSGLKFKVDFNKNLAHDDAYDAVSKGYYIVHIRGLNYFVHRIAWLLTSGSISKDMVVDHINRNRSDNNIENLALVSMSHNMRNRVLPLPSSGYRNITMKVSKTGVIRFCLNYTKPLHDSRSKEVFSTTKYPNAIDAFLAAYNRREELIASGLLLDVIRDGEKPIEETKMYLQSLINGDKR